MKINSIKYGTKEELINKLYNVTMLEDPDVKVYKSSYISIERLNTDCIVPPQNYVLNYELRNKLELKYALEEYNIDLFNIDGYIEFYSNNTKITLLPPIIEESVESNGMIVPIICDGMHRCYLARVERKKIEVVYIRGISKKYPYYAYPVLGGWDKVDKINSLEKGYIKKWHRTEKDKKLYRNFDSVFTNCSKQRKSTK